MFNRGTGLSQVGTHQLPECLTLRLGGSAALDLKAGCEIPSVGENEVARGEVRPDKAQEISFHNVRWMVYVDVWIQRKDFEVGCEIDVMSH